MPMASAHTCLVSIHTPLAGSDFRYSSLTSLNVRFQSTLPLRGVTSHRMSVGGSQCVSIHTPLAGSDADAVSHGHLRQQFQSTLPLRGVTVQKTILHPVLIGFNPHSPCGE